MQTESTESLKLEVIIMETYIKALTKAHGNVGKASELLGIDRRTVQRNMKLYGLSRETYL